MKRFLLSLVFGLVCSVGFSVPVYSVMPETTGTQVFNAAATTSNVLSTTFTLSPQVSAVHVYVNVLRGSLTSQAVFPAGCLTNAASTSYIPNPEYTESFSASGQYHVRIPAEQFGGKYAGIYCVGVGTTTNNWMSVSYKLETYQ
jgi:hypothetical protein